MSLTAGTFLNNDPGYQVQSTHSFGDYRLIFYYRETGPGTTWQTPNKRSFIGFNIAFPIGPARSWQLGPVTLRGRDQYPLGLETKVKEKDNYIEPGYGLFPSVRHGLNDVMDYQRGDAASLAANEYQLITSIRTQILKSTQ
jgi:hypothetical protein